ncbi:hypothetical protein RB213_009754 [Colletotrichum asianum]
MSCDVVIPSPPRPARQDATTSRLQSIRRSTQRRNECVWTGSEFIIDDLATSWPHSVCFSAPEPKPVDDAGTRRRREVDEQGTLS